MGQWFLSCISTSVVSQDNIVAAMRSCPTKMRLFDRPGNFNMICSRTGQVYSKKQFTHSHSHKVVDSAGNKAGFNILICLFGNPSGGVLKLWDLTQENIG